MCSQEFKFEILKIIKNYLSEDHETSGKTSMLTKSEIELVMTDILANDLENITITEINENDDSGTELQQVKENFHLGVESISEDISSISNLESSTEFHSNETEEMLKNMETDVEPTAILEDSKKLPNLVTEFSTKSILKDRIKKLVEAFPLRMGSSYEDLSSISDLELHLKEIGEICRNVETGVDGIAILKGLFCLEAAGKIIQENQPPLSLSEIADLQTKIQTIKLEIDKYMVITENKDNEIASKEEKENYHLRMESIYKDLSSIANRQLNLLNTEGIFRFGKTDVELTAILGDSMELTNLEKTPEPTICETADLLTDILIEKLENNTNSKLTKNEGSETASKPVNENFHLGLESICEDLSSITSISDIELPLNETEEICRNVETDVDSTAILVDSMELTNLLPNQENNSNTLSNGSNSVILINELGRSGTFEIKNPDCKENSKKCKCCSQFMKRLEKLQKDLLAFCTEFSDMKSQFEKEVNQVPVPKCGLNKSPTLLKVPFQKSSTLIKTPRLGSTARRSMSFSAIKDKKFVSSSPNTASFRGIEKSRSMFQDQTKNAIPKNPKYANVQSTIPKPLPKKK